MPPYHRVTRETIRSFLDVMVRHPFARRVEHGPVGGTGPLHLSYICPSLRSIGIQQTTDRAPVTGPGR